MSTNNFWQAGRYFPHRWGTIPLQTGITLGRRRDELKKRILWGLAAAAGLLLIALIWILDIPHWQKLDLDKIYAQPASSVVYDTSGEPVGALSGTQARVWTPLSEIPESVRNAFLAAEDHRFYEHCGISVRRILAAAVANLRSGGYDQGASTITQQLIKLTHLSAEKTLSRKAQEAFLALQLEQVLSKDEILECYLNTINFGSGAYGIAAAAQTFFDKEVSELTLAESALLAAVIKSPSGYAPDVHPDRAVERRDGILDDMAEYGYITLAQAEATKAQPLVLHMAEISSSGSYGWFLDAALDEAAELLNLGVDDVLTSGLRIYTAFDPAIQDAADALFADDANFPADASDGTPVQAAFVAIRPDTGEICALVGGREYEVRRGLNRATQIQRSPGSAIKPVSAYAAAIDAYGFSPTSFVEDTPRTFDGGYEPGNAGGASYGTVTLREALSRSLNIATVDLADLIGVDAVRAYALRFGLPLDDQDDNLALSLGSMTYGVSPTQLCAAYAALANGGMRVEPHLIARIEDAEGNALYEAEAPSERAVQESTAAMLTDMLATAATGGSAHALSAAGVPVAGKTGTVSDADGSTRDIWTAAYTPDLALTVWMGFDNPDESHRLSASEGGSGAPARLCAALLESVSDALSGADFAQPATVRTALIDTVALENDEVRLATEWTPADCTAAELFHADAMPTEFSEEWDAPEAVGDLELVSGSGETPILQFTALDENAEYLLLRSSGGATETVAVLTGLPGEVIRYADESHDLTQRARYTVLPRHRLLYERGTLLTGDESAAVEYSPGGVLDWLFGSDAAQATPEPAEIEVNEVQSMFG